MKRILSVLLTLSMILGLLAGLAITGSAAETESIEVTGIPEAIEVGGTASTDGIAVPADAPYSIESIKWLAYNYDENCFSSFDGPFQDNTMYRLQVRLTGEKGSMPYGTPVYVNGQPSDNYTHYNTDLFDIQIDYPLGIQVIDEVQITAMPEMKAGASTDLSAVQFPDGANYKLDISSTWYWEGGEYSEPTLGTGIYYLDLYIVPTEGYWISRDAFITADMESDSSWYGSSGELYARYCYDTTEKLEQVELTIAEPVLGEAVDNTITVPEDAKYTAQGQWLDYETDEPATTFENGKGYYLSIELTAVEGCSFMDDTLVTINDEACDNYWFYEDSGYVYYEVSFLEALETVDFPAIPEVKLGDTAEPVMASYDTYEVIGMWTAMIDGEMETFDGTFQDGTAYCLVMVAMANSGYEITEDTKITVNGGAYSGLSMALDGQAIVAKTIAFGLEVIDTVELIAATPEEGKELGEISIPEDANYQLMDAYWGESETGSIDDITDPTSETFEEGKHYALGVGLMPNDGYVFADDLAVTVNGKAVTLYSDSIILGIAAQLAVDMGTVESNAEPPIDTNGNAPTGDETPLVLMAVVMLVSMAALCATVVTGKKYSR